MRRSTTPMSSASARCSTRCASGRKTRFLVITHNPITMSRVDRLFGVTMMERGVSQLVSVDLKGAMDVREMAVA